MKVLSKHWMKIAMVLPVVAMIFAFLGCPNNTTPTTDDTPGGDTKVATPTANIPEGPIPKNSQVSLSTTTVGATIRYNTTNVDPTVLNTTIYTSPIVIAQATTIKAFAVKDGMTNSDVFTVTYTIDANAVATPVAFPQAGPIIINGTVTLTSDTSDATIYYTTDGTMPTESSTEYTGPIAITQDMTIKAFAVKDGMTDSQVLIAPYTTVPASTTTYTDRGYGPQMTGSVEPYPTPARNGVAMNWIRYEAEKAAIVGFSTGNGKIMDNDPPVIYSDNKAVGDLAENWAEDTPATSDWGAYPYLKFTITVPTAGSYRVNLIYQGGDAKEMLMKLNYSSNNVTLDLLDRPGVDWTYLFNKQFVIGEFIQGVNELYISGVLGKADDIGDWMTFDCIDVAPGPYDSDNPLEYETTVAIENFFTTHATILGKTVSNVAIIDYYALEAAQAAFDVLSTDEKNVLGTQENLLTALAQKINQLIEAEVAEFKTEYASALALRVDENDTFGTGDIVSLPTDAEETLVQAALDAYDDLLNLVKASLNPEHEHLLGLIGKIRELNQVVVEPELINPLPNIAFDLWLSADTPTRAANLGLSPNTKTITVSDYINDKNTGSSYTAVLASASADHVTISEPSGTPLTFTVTGASVGTSTVTLAAVGYPSVEVVFTFTVKTSSLTGIGRQTGWAVMAGDGGNVTDGTGADSNAVYSHQTNAGHNTGKTPVAGEVTIWSFELRSHNNDDGGNYYFGANTNDTTNNNMYRFSQMSTDILFRLGNDRDTWLATSSIQPFTLNQWVRVDVVFDRTTANTLRLKMFADDVQVVFLKDINYSGSVVFEPDGTIIDTDETRLDNLGPWLFSRTWGDSETDNQLSFRPLQYN